MKPVYKRNPIRDIPVGSVVRVYFPDHTTKIGIFAGHCGFGQSYGWVSFAEESPTQYNVDQYGHWYSESIAYVRYDQVYQADVYRTSWPVHYPSCPKCGVAMFLDRGTLCCTHDVTNNMGAVGLTVSADSIAIYNVQIAMQNNHVAGSDIDSDEGSDNV